MDLVVQPAKRALQGAVSVPSDKSIGHRVLLFAALAEGESVLSGFSGAADNVSTMDALRAMGVHFERPEAETVVVRGVGLRGLRAPSAPLDCGNSGTTMRVLAGVLAAQPFDSELFGDATLMRRPMRRIVAPLRARGARIDGQPRGSGDAEDILPPLRIRGVPAGGALTGLSWDSAVASAQVKTAILLSGLYASGPTRFTEPVLSRDHTERLLRALGVPLHSDGHALVLDPTEWRGVLPPIRANIPGDPSAAAFLVTAAQLVRDSRVAVRGVGVNPTRTGFFDIADEMGARLQIAAVPSGAGEPVAEITSRWNGALGGITAGGERVTRAIDEVPIACALAARAAGRTVIRDASELRVKESDRLHTMAEVLSAYGVECIERPDGLEIEGRATPLRAASIDSKGDHRIAMTAAILSLVADGPCTIHDAACIGTSFPAFVDAMRTLGAELVVRD